MFNLFLGFDPVCSFHTPKRGPSSLTIAGAERALEVLEEAGRGAIGFLIVNKQLTDTQAKLWLRKSGFWMMFETQALALCVSYPARHLDDVYCANLHDNGEQVRLRKTSCHSFLFLMASCS